MSVCVCLFFPLSDSTLFLITEHREEREAVELILWEEEENLKEQSRNKWKHNETTENTAVFGGSGGEIVGSCRLILCNRLWRVLRKVRVKECQMKVRKEAWNRQGQKTERKWKKRAGRKPIQPWWIGGTSLHGFGCGEHYSEVKNNFGS